ncbi:MAG TPA: SRPBCC family protein [Bacteroidia bacterium]|nr:SRPBCC family protein [Bacteroidia bacterium]
MTSASSITVEVKVNAPLEKVWDYWTNPQHIVNWNYASEDWHAPHATNDLRVGGKFNSRMEAKDGSMGFDFEGEYTKVEQHIEIEYVLADARRVNIRFDSDGRETTVTETFDPENENTLELQRAGWQAILDNFKRYTESN